MKQKSMVVTIVALIALFVFLAGGFTKSGSHYETTCVDPDDPLGILSENPLRDYVGDEWCFEHEVKSEVFDPRSTAMFVIGGLIITLTIGLRKAKREATSD